MLTRIIAKIKRRDNPVANSFYIIAKFVLSFNVPAFQCVFIPLLATRTILITTFTWFMQKLLNEPMLKARCVHAGENIRIDKGFPYIAAHLSLTVGDHVTIDGKNTFAATSVYDTPQLIIGSRCYIGYGVTISVGKRIEIGDNSLIAAGAFICDNNGHPTAPKNRQDKVSPQQISPVVIGNNVWIGTNVFIGRGVTIGDNSIIGANSVITQNVPANCIFSSGHGDIIRYFQDDEIR